MNEQQENELLANVKSITDRLNIVDVILASARIGKEMVMVFICGESGLFYPADYVRNWGKDWGDGLGPSPVSESLQSEYDISPPAVTNDIQDLTQIMHPLRNSFAQMDFHLAPAEDAALNMAIPMKGDERMRLRTPILYAKQLKNPASKISRYQGLSLKEAEFQMKRQGGFR